MGGHKECGDPLRWSRSPEIAWAGYPQNLWIDLGIKRVFRGGDSGMAAGEKRGRGADNLPLQITAPYSRNGDKALRMRALSDGWGEACRRGPCFPRPQEPVLRSRKPLEWQGRRCEAYGS